MVGLAVDPLAPGKNFGRTRGPLAGGQAVSYSNECGLQVERSWLKYLLCCGLFASAAAGLLVFLGRTKECLPAVAFNREALGRLPEKSGADRPETGCWIPGTAWKNKVFLMSKMIHFSAAENCLKVHCSTDFAQYLTVPEMIPEIIADLPI
ncbi:MAG: hypothetical protein P0Y53_23590 [Candidatus Pseudobacter hemicellulosilyticus]|uniref:Uncharacterized protein n=1 Tax=Candidatus Pseudobacter hemicellulosilyticus TaxID=3121375 RepID=A0AAJ5WP10_9BACT|nr:MAG: hypothetical protein P0Y53_23590 [Pseudobacter sp.]